MNILPLSKWLIPLTLLATGMQVAAKENPKSKKDEETKAWTQTEHTIKVRGKSLEYTAMVGEFVLGQAENKPSASMSFIAYEKKNGDVSRPITFFYNGGPGSSSVWLHLGAFGPKRVVLNEQESFDPNQLGITINEASLLSFTDLVFIDPIETGYSRENPKSGSDNQNQAHDKDPSGSSAKVNYFSPEEDADSVAEFIRLYTTRQGRWLSPKYIGGESYGTTRSVLVAEALHEKYLMSVAGILLISSVLDFTTLWDKNGSNLLPYALILPSLTSIAWYHKKLHTSLQEKQLPEVVQLAREFVLDTYLPFLHKSGFASEEQQQEIAEKLAFFTGLDVEFVKKQQLKISQGIFRKQLLLADEGMILGRFSGTFKALAIDESSPYPRFDPSADLIAGAFKAGIEHYLLEDLGVKQDRNYNVFGDIWQKWQWGQLADNNYLSVSGKLHKLLIKSPSLRVFVANGYYDLATPFFATEYTFSHLAKQKQQKSRILMKYYQGGHMMYTNPQERLKLANDIEGFYLRKP